MFRERGVYQTPVYGSPQLLRRYEMNLEDIIRLWYKTQMGNMHECKKNQIIFSNIMWKLYEKLKEKE